MLKQQFDATGRKLKLNDCQRRSLAEKAKKLGKDQLEKYVNLVTPKTLMAWHRRLIALKYTAKRTVNTEGQKRMQVIRQLCIKFAQENDHRGYGRIQGALANLGYDVCESTVGNILRKEGILPSPERAKRTNWKRFLRNHLSVISAADFFTTEVWTPHGLVRYLSFFVINIAKREVRIVHTGCQVNGEVMCNLARELTNDFDGLLRGIKYLILDNDPLYTPAFIDIIEKAGVTVQAIQPNCPQQNGYAESFVKCIKRECLDHFIFLGENSLQKAISEYMKHFHHERNHQGLENVIPFPYASAKADESSEIRRFERLGGLLIYYHRDNGKEELKVA